MAKGICETEAQSSAAKPHVTVMSSTPIPFPQLRNALSDLASEFGPVELTFSHLGVFPADKPVLFLGVTPTATLMSLHRRLFDLISPISEVPTFAMPDVFVFHCTLGFVLKPKLLPRAIEIASTFPLPGAVKADSFDLVEYDSGAKRLASFNFSSHAKS
jgi:2'-5' RNA ligase